MYVFVKGLIVGLLIALPVGPVAILCIQRTLTQGRRHGLASGLGAACADAVYGAVAVFGLSCAATWIQQYSTLIHWVGGIALCLIGLRTFLSPPNTVAAPQGRIAHAGNFLSTFLLTLLNPMTVLAFAAVFANAGLAQCSHASATRLIAGIFCGSSLWWLTLCLVTNRFRHLIVPAHFHLVNRIAGALIVTFGILLMLHGNVI